MDRPRSRQLQGANRILKPTMLEISRAEFERTVSRALGSIPDELRQRFENITVVIEEEPTADELREVGLDPATGRLFGLYHGVPWGERGWDYGGALPDRIVIYRLPLLEACATREQLIEEIQLTVIHEVGHYFGLDEDQLP